MTVEDRDLVAVLGGDVRKTIELGVIRTVDIRRVLALVMPALPDVRLQLVDADQPCDARIVSQGLTKPRETFVPMWSERYVLALPPTHPLALQPVLRAADLAGLAIIDRCYCENRALIARAKAQFETVAISHSEDWTLALVAAIVTNFRGARARRGGVPKR